MSDSLKKEIGRFLILFSLIYVAVLLIIILVRSLEKIKRAEIFSPVFISSGKEECSFIREENSILISRIEIEAPLIFLEDSGSDFEKALDEGVVHYPESALPGEKGVAVFLGHSAPLGWPKIHYDWVFSALNKLESGDEVYISYNNHCYHYIVLDKSFLDKGEELPEDLSEDSSLVLISCWPPGRNLKRIAVRAILDRN